MPILIVLICFFSISAHAHDLWLERENQDLVLYYGHLSTAHSSSKRLAYQPENIEVSCLDANGHAQAVTLTRASSLRIHTPCALTRVIRDSGYWSKTPYGTKNLPKNQAEAVVRSWQSRQSVIYLDTWHEGFAHTEDVHGLVLVATHNPFALTADAKLRLQVRYQGQALAGATLLYQGQACGLSDSAGYINIRLKQSGLQFFQVSHKTPLASPLADEIIDSAALVFSWTP
jgi:nickel transport protein